MLKDKEKLKEYRKKYYEKNKDTLLKKSKEKRLENIEEARRRQRELRSKNRDKINSRDRDYYQKNKELILNKLAEKRKDPIYIEKKKTQNKKWREKNPTYSSKLRKRKRANMTPEELIKDKERVKLQSRNARAHKLGFKNYQEYLNYKAYQKKIKDINSKIKKIHWNARLKYWEKNKEKNRLTDLQKRKEKRKIDIQYKLLDNLRCRTRKILRIQ